MNRQHLKKHQLAIGGLSLAAMAASGFGVAAAQTSPTPTSTPSATSTTRTAPSGTTTTTPDSSTKPAGTTATAPAHGAGPRPGGRSAKHDLTVVSVQGSTVSLTDAGGVARTVTVAADVKVERAGQSIKLTDIQAGDKVRLHMEKQSDGTEKLTAVTVVLPKVDGVVASGTSSALSVTGRDGTATSVALTATTTYTKFGKTIAASAVAVGDKIHAEGQLNASGKFTALSVHVDAPKSGGDVTALNGTTITVSEKGATKTLTVTSATTYPRAGQAAALTDIKVGSRLHAEGTVAADGSFTAVVVKIELPKVHGDVTAVNGSTVTVTDRDQARTFTVTATTVFTKGGVAATLGDVKAGVHVDAEGTASSDGTITAVAVKIRA